jgi:hypothetical protein
MEPSIPVKPSNIKEKDIVMESHEVMRKAFKKFGDKNVAAALKLSEGTINKWFRPRGDKGTGRISPLDRVAELAALPGGEALLVWLCERAGGKFVQGEKLRALVCQECEEKIAKLEAIMKMGDGRWQLGDGGGKIGNRKLEIGNAGGSRCRHRLPDGRCGWRAGRN